MTPAPAIEQRWVCIAASDQTLLAAQLSSYFNDSGTYFAVFDFPAMERAYEEVPTKGTDTYFPQIIGRRSATHINNCLAQLAPRSIILLGLSSAAQSYLRAILPDHLLVTVNTEAELLAQPFATGGEVPLTCRPSQAIEGLMAAKTAGKPLRFSDDAPDLPSRLLRGKQSLLVVENSGGVGEVAMINYAASIDGDIVLAGAVERNKLQSIPRDLQTWARDHSSPALQATRKKITSRDKTANVPRPGGPPPREDWDETLIAVGRGAEGFDVTPNGKELWSANAQDGTISILDLMAKKVTQTLDANIQSANRLKFTPNGKMAFISALRLPDAVVFDVTGRKE